jgi:hypothetical protein
MARRSPCPAGAAPATPPGKQNQTTNSGRAPRPCPAPFQPARAAGGVLRAASRCPPPERGRHRAAAAVGHAAGLRTDGDSVSSVTTTGMATATSDRREPALSTKIKGPGMPWVRGHYARSPRTSRHSETRLALIVLACTVAQCPTGPADPLLPRATARPASHAKPRSDDGDRPRTSRLRPIRRLPVGGLHRRVAQFGAHSVIAIRVCTSAGVPLIRVRPGRRTPRAVRLRCAVEAAPVRAGRT